jgi:serine/threonine protein phosphatase PrpC
MVIGCRSDPGKTRKENEDSFVIFSFDFVYESRRKNITLLVIADGMGGHKSGEKASELGVGGITEAIINRILARDHIILTGEDIKNSIQTAAREVNVSLFNLGERNSQLKGMGTTLTLALVMGNAAYIGHVGDSRAYIVSKDEMRQITRDHSLVQEMVDRGELTPEEARTHPRKNIITRAIGVYKDIDVDVYEEYIFGDDYLLLCCDGLTDMVTDQEIYTVVMSNDDPQQICDILIQKANEKGGRDNISVIVAQFDELPLREEDEEEETEIKRSPEVEEKTHVY